jgi:predicted methyltransferase
MQYLNKQFARPTFPNDRISWISKITALATTNDDELELLDVLRNRRPESLRRFDQIPMRSLDLLCQVKWIAPKLQNKSVVFIGDHDGTSILIGMLASKGIISPPSRLLMLDFDDRLIHVANNLSKEFKFNNIFSAQLYNVFDPIPNGNGEFDWFYSNPPYGSNNRGNSACLFIARGIEHLKFRQMSRGCVILPMSNSRNWARVTINTVRKFLRDSNWLMREKFINTHKYHLDDDPELSSSAYSLVPLKNETKWNHAYLGSRVPFVEFPNFYSGQDKRPYPRYIKNDGGLDYSW